MCVAAWAADEPLSRKQADEILSELREVRRLLEKQYGVQPQIQPTPSPVEVDVSDSPSMGSKDAPFVVVEFTDYECPFCQRFFHGVFRDLKKSYIDTGRVRFVVQDFPLEIHQNALLAAQSGQCANDQGVFWAMHDKMQANSARLTMDDFVDYARQLNLDVARFSECLQTGKYRQEIQRRAEAAKRSGVRGTPSFVIGKSTSEGVEGELIVGAVPLDVFESKLK
jgi:protein-disulfide isomerase